MMPPRTRTFHSNTPVPNVSLSQESLITVIFMGLNGVRFLSIVSLILVFASTIFVMVTNVKAVNAFEANRGNSTVLLENCDYIE
jgi:hypothetical protein